MEQDGQNQVPSFACGMCGKCFADADQCRIHIQSHTGSRSFPCIICWPLFYDMQGSGGGSQQPCAASSPMPATPISQEVHVQSSRQTASGVSGPSQEIAAEATTALENEGVRSVASPTAAVVPEMPSTETSQDFTSANQVSIRESSESFKSREGDKTPNVCIPITTDYGSCVKVIVEANHVPEYSVTELTATAISPGMEANDPQSPASSHQQANQAPTESGTPAQEFSSHFGRQGGRRVKAKPKRLPNSLVMDQRAQEAIKSDHVYSSVSKDQTTNESVTRAVGSNSNSDSAAKSTPLSLSCLPQESTPEIATEVIEDATEVIEDATEVIEDATEVIDDAIEVIEDARPTVEKAEDINEESCPKVQNSSKDSPVNFNKTINFLKTVQLQSPSISVGSSVSAHRLNSVPLNSVTSITEEHMANSRAVSRSAAVSDQSTTVSSDSVVAGLFNIVEKGKGERAMKKMTVMYTGKSRTSDTKVIEESITNAICSSSSMIKPVKSFERKPIDSQHYYPSRPMCTELSAVGSNISSSALANSTVSSSPFRAPTEHILEQKKSSSHFNTKLDTQNVTINSRQAISEYSSNQPVVLTSFYETLSKKNGKKSVPVTDVLVSGIKTTTNSADSITNNMMTLELQTSHNIPTRSTTGLHLSKDTVCEPRTSSAPLFARDAVVTHSKSAKPSASFASSLTDHAEADGSSMAPPAPMSSHSTAKGENGLLDACQQDEESSGFDNSISLRSRVTKTAYVSLKRIDTDLKTVNSLHLWKNSILSHSPFKVPVTSQDDQSPGKTTNSNISDNEEGFVSDTERNYVSDSDATVLFGYESDYDATCFPKRNQSGIRKSTRTPCPTEKMTSLPMRNRTPSPKKSSAIHETHVKNPNIVSSVLADDHKNSDKGNAVVFIDEFQMESQTLHGILRKTPSQTIHQPQNVKVAPAAIARDDISVSPVPEKQGLQSPSIEKHFADACNAREANTAVYASRGRSRKRSSERRSTSTKSPKKKIKRKPRMGAEKQLIVFPRHEIDLQELFTPGHKLRNRSAGPSDEGESRANSDSRSSNVANAAAERISSVNELSELAQSPSITNNGDETTPVLVSSTEIFGDSENCILPVIISPRRRKHDERNVDKTNVARVQEDIPVLDESPLQTNEVSESWNKVSKLDFIDDDASIFCDAASPASAITTVLHPEANITQAANVLKKRAGGKNKRLHIDVPFTSPSANATSATRTGRKYSVYSSWKKQMKDAKVKPRRRRKSATITSEQNVHSDMHSATHLVPPNVEESIKQAEDKRKSSVPTNELKISAASVAEGIATPPLLETPLGRDDFLVPKAKGAFKTGKIPHARFTNFVLNNGLSKFECNKCHAKFRKHVNLLRHKYNKCKDRFYCDTCGNSFGRRETLSMHIKIMHTGEAAVDCHVCRKQLSSLPSLKSHMRIHTEEKPFECSVCGKTFRLQSSLVSHYRIHTGDRPFKCKQCNKSYRHNKNLYDHKFTHTGERRHICPICDMAFYQAGNLSNHMKSQHDRIKPFVCEYCDKRFVRKVQLFKHKRSDHVDELIAVEAGLEKNISKAHSCPHCHRGFTTTFARNRHIKDSCIALHAKEHNVTASDEQA